MKILKFITTFAGKRGYRGCRRGEGCKAHFFPPHSLPSRARCAIHARDAAARRRGLDVAQRVELVFDNEAARSDRTLTFPGPRSPVDYRVSPPPGTETYLLVATEQPLRWLAPADIRRRGALTELNLTGGELQQRLRAVLERQNPYSWNGTVLNLPVDY